MRSKFLTILPALLFQVATAQNGSASISSAQTSTQTTVTPTYTSVITPNESAAPTTASFAPSQTLIMDYQSVYETATAEEEVKIATERFNLTPDQQDLWLAAANDRRLEERKANERINSNIPSYDKEGAYRGLRSAQNMFYETIIGHLSPAQKQALEADRLIRDEKQKRLAKLPPPTVPTTVTVVPVDSTSIKAEEKAKASGKKSKKKKKVVGG